MNKNMKGFTLIEMMLVMVIIAMVLYGSISFYQQKVQEARFDRTTAQMQQILNAGLAYYVANSDWPESLTCLQGGAAAPCDVVYLPRNMYSPWGGGQYYVANDSTLFYVFTQITTTGPGAAASNVAASQALVVAGNLPLSYTTTAAPVSGTVPATGPACGTGASCTVVGAVNIPGDNLNSARSVNFAGLYHNGACVPVPHCPAGSMVPQIFVAPVSVSGLNDDDTRVYPISSFTAYATGDGASNTPAKCEDDSAGQNYTATCPGPGSYWRVCLHIVTEKGVLTTTSDWGLNTTVLALTRCAVNNETSGSEFTVYE